MQERYSRQTRNAALLDHLSDFDYRSALERLRKLRFQNPNGLWLAQTSQYQEWLLKDGSSVFLLSGKMGSGKSVLVSAVVDDILLQNFPDGCLKPFFFCEHDKARSLTARTILGSLTRQSLPHGDLGTVLEKQLHSLLDDGEANGDELGSFMIAQFNTARTHIIIVDGLDECPEGERDLVLDTFKALFRRDKPMFKLFLCGRDDIFSEVCTELNPAFQMTMNCESVSEDIGAFIDASLAEKQLKKEARASRSSTHSSRQRRAEIEGARNVRPTTLLLMLSDKGRFLWVSLMIEDLCAQTCDDEIRATINHLPATLSEVFERALLRIIRTGKSEIASRMFS